MKITSCIFTALCGIGLLAYFTGQSKDALPAGIVSGVFALIMWIATFARKNKLVKNTDSNNNPWIHMMYLPHVNGLSIPQGIQCSIKMYQDKFVFQQGKMIIDLTMDKITDITIKPETEIKTSYVSSTGGAVAGALMFGALGAIIGGRVKTKNEQQTNYYLIITYISDEIAKYLAFDATDPIVCLEARKFQTLFPKHIQEVQHISL